MNIHFVDVDQPTTCPLCGARTDFTQIETTFPFTQIHKCLDISCGYTFIGEIDENQLKELKFQ